MNFYPNNPLMLGQANFNPYLNQVPLNPVIPNYQSVVPQGPRMQIDTVNGKEAAFAYNMGPNSSVILADAMEAKVWVVTTDSAGYKVVKGFNITPDEEEKPPVVQTESDQISALSERIQKLEERMNSYGESDVRVAGQIESDGANAKSNDEYGSNGKRSDAGNKSNSDKQSTNAAGNASHQSKWRNG